MQQRRIAPQSHWQNPYVERLIGSIRRECLDHVIVFNERSLRRILRSYVAYHQRWRTHLALGKDAPITRKVQPPKLGQVIELPEMGGLHRRYVRQAACEALLGIGSELHTPGSTHAPAPTDQRA